MVSGGKPHKKGSFGRKAAQKRAVAGEKPHKRSVSGVKPHKRGSFGRKAAQKGAVSGERPHKKGQ